VLTRASRIAVLLALSAGLALPPAALGEGAQMQNENQGPAPREGVVGYASIRVVRSAPAEPSRPEIVLPAGYRLHDEGNYGVASPAEYYVFLEGPPGVARGVRVRWPGSAIQAVLHNHTRLPLRQEEGAVACDVPVMAASLRAAWPTLEVWSSLGEKDLPIRIEHNSPGRRAGTYAQRPWVKGQAAACIHYLIASREILRDWSLHHQIAAEKLGHISLMGFESNNPLHGDSPAHWHFIYYWPTEAGSQVPHFYMDGRGRTVENNIFVFARKDLSRVAKARDPMVFTDPKGKVRFAIDIRPDGGADIGPSPGDWKYSIVAGDEGEDFTRSVRVLRGGKPWLRVAATDDTAAGVLTIRVEQLDGSSEPSVETRYYDPLTGTPRKASQKK